MLSLTIRLQTSEWPSTWRQESARLFVAARSAPRLRERAAVHVHLSGQPAGVTVVGTVVSVHRHEGVYRVELALDADSLGAAHLLDAAARGELARLPQRPPRYLFTLPVVVNWAGADLYMTTRSISGGGCALRWSGPIPAVGRPLRLRLGAGLRAPELTGEVRWNAPAGAGSTVGVRFVGNGGAARAWGGVLAEAAKSGAPRT